MTHKQQPSSEGKADDVISDLLEWLDQHPSDHGFSASVLPKTWTCKDYQELFGEEHGRLLFETRFSTTEKDEQEQAKQEFRSALMLELMEIKKGLMTLLSENERVTDLERLDRDEFVIDVKRKDQVFDEGEKECDEIRKEAEKTVLRLQLLRERVK